MDLGTFSVSLSVKDLAKSRAFYEALGFEPIAGDPDSHYLILKNGEAKVGLFQGMFEGNLLTFNPADARGLEAALDAAGIAIERRTEGESGPTHFVLRDPDGNVVLVDQH